MEPVSIDEAFLDVTASRRALGSGEAVARRLKQEIEDWKDRMIALRKERVDLKRKLGLSWEAECLVTDRSIPWASTPFGGFPSAPP